jgi:hypothetical protein
VYILRERTVLSVGVASAPSEIRALVEEARGRDKLPEDWPSSVEQGSPIRVVIADGGHQPRHE